jgi:hypothetical protein
MSEEIKDKSKKSASKPTKKRTVYSQQSMLEFPEWAKQDKSHKYRWVSTRQLAARSDGYDPRGWSTAKDPETGETLKAYDVILARMPADEHAEMVEFKNSEKRNFVKHLTDNMDSQSDKLRYEVERLGGKIGKMDFSMDKE